VPEYTQANRALQITTPLGADELLITGLDGREALSELFHFELELLAENRQEIAFDKLLGQKAVVSLDTGDGKKRYFAGIISQFSQGKRDAEMTRYKAEFVPQLWLLTLRRQSRIFQHLSVPDILKQVLTGLNVTYEITGTFQPRNYCVQYRESDFDFASRLMEEEGIYYYFRHDADGHTLVLGNSSLSSREVSPGKVIFEESTSQTQSPAGITVWNKTQQVRPSKYTLWDHTFQLPQHNLEASRTIAEGQAVGKVTHKLKLPATDALEVYDYPGAYAQRFDGIGPSGAERPADVQKIFEDNVRTAKIRMEQEAVPGLFVRGVSDCRQFMSGHKFTLSRHFNGDGAYLLTGVEHSARTADDYRSGSTGTFQYQNRFTCIPAEVPFRPQQVTPKPVITGMQTALVVGMPGETLFCDKYGRVKVQFFWDRQGKKNADSSCWVRVGQTSAGQGFGTVNLPRIGHEVMVAFLEGDPDRPIIAGVVYNADNMPPYKLPDHRTYSGQVHRSHGGVAKNASEIRFQNDLGSELLVMHAETDALQQVENNHLVQVGNIQRQEVGKFYHIKVGKPVNVNQGAVGIASSAAGSGAGGGGGGQPGPTGTAPGDTGPDTTTLPDGTEDDIYDKGPGLQTDIEGHNVTNITEDDHYWCGGSSFTEIDGSDVYVCVVSQDSVVTGAVNSYESSLIDVVGGPKMEYSGIIHVDLALLKVNDDGMSTNFSWLKLLTLG
jgi:type VI secretion system secreted protein VgrG